MINSYNSRNLEDYKIDKIVSEKEHFIINNDILEIYNIYK